jgi:peptide/nickel transport system ATP-binding protein
MSAPSAPAPVEQPPLLELREVGKTFVSGRFGNRRVVRAVREVSLQVEAGQSLGLVGESGSGKSTVARLIARLVKPTAGQILLRGRDVIASEPRSPSREYRHQVQMIFQDPFSSLNPVHTVGYHIERALRIHGTVGDQTIEAATASLLDSVGLSGVPGIVSRFPHELSGGQRQRLAIARTLAARPALLVADEPTSMVDVSVRVGILNLLNDLRQARDFGLILITHDLASARYSTGQTLVMYAGFIVESGPSEPLIAKPMHPYTQLLVASVPRRSSVGGATVTDSDRDGRVAHGRGCPFAPRCPSRMSVCSKSMPAVQPLEGGRWVRCHLFGPGETGGPGPGWKNVGSYQELTK